MAARRRAPGEGARSPKDGRAKSEEDDASWDRLFAAPLADFIATRKALVAELRARGEPEAAKAIAAARKPTPTAWAVNQVARHHPDVLARLSEAGAAVHEAQRRALAKGDASQMRDAMRALNARIAEAVQEAKRALSGAGRAATTTQLRAIARTLHAMPLAAPEDVEALTRGRLTRDLDPASDLSALGIAPTRAATADEEEHDADEAPSPRKRPHDTPPTKPAAHTKPPKRAARSKPARTAAEERRAQKDADNEARRREREAAAREAREAKARACEEQMAARARATREAAAARLEARASAASEHARTLVAAAEAAERQAQRARAAADDAEARAKEARREAEEARDAV